MTKTLALIVIFSFSTFQAFSQYQLDTPDGKKVKLNTDGTWTFVKTDNRLGNTTLPKTSTAKYISVNQKYAIWYDPKQWIHDTTKSGAASSWDATFYSKDYAVTGYCIDERLTTSVDNFDAFIRSQWNSAGDIKSLDLFKDTINNVPMTGFNMLLQYEGSLYQYKGYVHATPTGTFQFVVGTQKAIFEEDKKRIDQFLMGIVKL